MKNPRILKICNLGYYHLVRDLYRKYPFIKTLQYREQKQFLKSYAPIYLNSFSDIMSDLGYEADEVIVDLESLQHSWATEYGSIPSKFGWPLEILLQQIEWFKPDIVYFQDVHAIPPAVRRRLKEFFPFIKKCILFRGFPLFQDGLEDVDLFVSGSPNLIREYKQSGLRTAYNPHGFDEKVLHYLQDWTLHQLREADGPFVFLGTSGFGEIGEFHLNRYLWLRKLLDQSDIKMYLVEGDTPCQEGSRPLREIAPSRTFESYFGLDMFHILKTSDIVFNIHSSAHPNQVENMRLFEATGVGACLLTDTGANMTDFFEEDREVAIYRSFDECIEKYRYLQNHVDARLEIAKAGQKRTLKEHTLRRRCERLHELIQELDYA